MDISVRSCDSGEKYVVIAIVAAFFLKKPDLKYTKLEKSPKFFGSNCSVSFFTAKAHHYFFVCRNVVIGNSVLARLFASSEQVEFENQKKKKRGTSKI